jgi:hypothetical protein
MSSHKNLEYKGFDDAYFGNPKMTEFGSREEMEAYERGYRKGRDAPRVGFLLDKGNG